jgi:hypothetical protein
MAEHRLGHPKLRRSAREASRPGHENERLQMVEIDLSDFLS